MVTFGGRALRTHALSLNQHLLCVAIGASCLIIGLLAKFIPIEEEEEGKMKLPFAKGLRQGFASKFSTIGGTSLIKKSKTSVKAKTN